jgi:Raf kinase inhibitor-like YbhB/YbcL family protein
VNEMIKDDIDFYRLTNRLGVLGLFACFLIASACAQASPPVASDSEIMDISVSSAAFRDGDTIPQKYTCDGEGISPPLAWEGVPEGAKSLALIADDPDAPAGTWVHWVLYNLASSSAGLPEGVPVEQVVAGMGAQGSNSSRKNGYSGPCPPGGAPHRYYFKLYALDIEPGLAPGATKADLEKAMQGHILARGQLMGRYGR